MVLLLVLVALASIVTHDASAGKKKPKKAKVSLTITTRNQAALLKAKKLTVKVKSTAKATVSLSAGKNFKSVKVKFKKNRKQTKAVNLALTSAGKKAMATCGAKSVSVTGKYKKGKKKATARAKKKLARDASKCETPIDYTTVPLGDDPEHCDFLDTTVCLQPFPNDYYTKDASTPTGKELNLGANATPTNSGHANPEHMSVTDINRADGFSPGSLISLKVPGLDTPAAFANSNLVPLNDISRYKDANASVVLIDAATGERQPIWAELDANPTSVDPTYDGDDNLISAGGINTNPTNTGPVNLLVRPAKNLNPGHRYVIAFRNLRDAGNQPIDAPVGFKVYRDNLPTQQAVVENRRAHMDSVLSDLSTKAGISKDGLYMAWDFTVASKESLTDRATTIRDDAFHRLGDDNLADKVIQGNSPTVQVKAFCDLGDTGSAQCGNNYPGRPAADFNPANPITSPVPDGSTNVQRTVVGYIKNVPCYLDANGCPSGSKFAFDSSGKITWNPSFTVDVPFYCAIPRSTTAGGAVHPGGTGTYGHGLLGNLGQIDSTPQISNATNRTYCAANWDGFSENDLGLIIQSLGNLSNFPKAVDRMQQGFINFLYLQRALVHPAGFAADPAFHMTFDGTTPIPVPDQGSAIDTSQGMNTRGTYYGISQGGIMGGALIALSPDIDRGVLGVPGMNYSTLLRRSVDSDGYFKIPGVGLYANYPDEASRPVLLSLMQLLWDRGEADGYANYMTDTPLENTNTHQVLMQLSAGDHQVSNFAGEVEARTIGAERYAPTLRPQRTWDTDYEGLPPVTTFPTTGSHSFMVYYDPGPPTYDGTGMPNGGRGLGSAVPPLENVPPRKEWGYGGDPHTYTRFAPDVISHQQTFVANGTLGECAQADGYCVSNGWDGSTGLHP